MQFSTKKMGGNFFFKKMPNWVGGSEGSLAKDHIFSGFSFVQPSLTSNDLFHDAGQGEWSVSECPISSLSTIFGGDIAIHSNSWISSQNDQFNTHQSPILAV